MPSTAALEFANKLDALPANKSETPQEHRERVAALLDEHVRSLVTLAAETRIMDRTAKRLLTVWNPRQ
jgi:hypothetical protein